MQAPYRIHLLLAALALLFVRTSEAQPIESVESGFAVDGIVAEATVTWEELVADEAARPWTEPRTFVAPGMPRVIGSSGPAGGPELDPPSGEIEGDIAPLAPTPRPPESVSSFPAIGFNGAIPPDPMGAVGPTYVMSTVNEGVLIQSRTGTTVQSMSLPTFWNRLGFTDVFDPKTIYDPLSGRFVVATLADAYAGTSALLLAVSATSDPTGTWYMVAYDADSANTAWVDFPLVGTNNRWITITGNMFRSSDGAWLRSNIWAIDKAALYSGNTSATYRRMETTAAATIAPVITFDSAMNTEFLITVADAATGSLRIFTITGTATTPTLTATSLYPTGTPWNDWIPEAPQAGHSRGVEAGQTEVQSAVLRSGSIWCTHMVGLPATSSVTRLGARWYQIDPTTGAIAQSGTIQDSTNTTWYFYPSIAVNSNLDVLIGFASASETSYVGGSFAYRQAADPAGTMRAPILLKAGEAPYFIDYGSGRNRWGDFSGTVVDPLDDLTFWTIQEYAESPSNAWGTWWGRISLNCSCPDADADGYYHDSCSDLDCTPRGDCAPDDDAVHPGATELCDGLDNDCSGGVPASESDADGDTWRACGGDCDDGDDAIHPGVSDLCDGADNDCNGAIDDTAVTVTGGGVPGAITDGATLNVYAAVSGIATVQDVNVRISLTHTWDEDLDIVLRSPAGTSVTLTTDNGGDGDNFTNTVFDDEAATSITAGAAPFSGSFRPESALSAFDGQAASGSWRLSVTDDADQDTGTLLSWSLVFTVSGSTDADADGATACTDCDDANPLRTPGRAEVCDGIDNDCDSTVDEGLPVSSWWPDTDADSYGAATGSPISACTAPPGRVSNNLDCNDSAPGIHPGATDLTGDSVDSNCDGAELCFLDADNDGYRPNVTSTIGSSDPDCTDDGEALSTDPAGDCNDANRNQYPGRTERCDGLDNDCDGLVPANETDDDGDGLDECGGLDCNDDDPLTLPGATERCDGADNNCDGLVPPGETDDDGDGYNECGGRDCDDARPLVYPGAPELCNTVDNDCDGSLSPLEIDDDGDGYNECGGLDCDDTNPVMYLGASEYCDGLDNNCDGAPAADEVDLDGDLFLSCGECDDTSPLTFPGASELCDGLDNDCDGLPASFEADADGDGVFACLDCDDFNPAVAPGATELCDGLDNDCDPATQEVDDLDGDGWSSCDGDCNDGDAAISPDAEEVCDGLDNDCDPTTDEVVDSDGDGFALCDGDCNDADDRSHPGAREACNGLDDDCDGLLPEDEADPDGDAFFACDGDCDDSDPLTWPGAPEQCDGYDNDCDGLATGEASDRDLDGFTPCEGDCDDGDPDRHPGASESCDGIDSDCDGALLDEESDNDGDGFDECTDLDCNDADPDAFPGHSESLAGECSDGADNDCNGLVDRDDPACEPGEDTGDTGGDAEVADADAGRDAELGDGGDTDASEVGADTIGDLDPLDGASLDATSDGTASDASIENDGSGSLLVDVEGDRGSRASPSGCDCSVPPRSRQGLSSLLLLALFTMVGRRGGWARRSAAR